MDLEQFSKQGFFVISHFLSADVVQEARSEILSFSQQQKFNPAKIGKAEHHQARTDIRSDSTLWWDFQNPTSVQKKISDQLQQIKNTLNQNFFLGLWDIEGHYAIYKPGAFYKKHVDRFQNDSKRTVSIVLFFNEGWKPEEGGQLAIEANSETHLIQPESGTLVCFLSDQIPHEVLATKRERLSFAGWFKTN